MTSYRQGNNLSNSKYLEIFRKKVEVFEMFGGEPGTCVPRINAQLNANGIVPANANENEIATAKKKHEKNNCLI